MGRSRQVPAGVAPRNFLIGFVLPAVSAGLSTHHQPEPAAGNSATAESIPRSVFFTGPWLPEDIVQRNRQFVPNDTQFHYYNYQQLDSSAKEISDRLESVGVPGVYAAMHQLRPMAYRADLWRLLILWDQGGVYFDAKMALQQDISHFVDERSDRFVACFQPYEMYWNGVLAARRQEPILVALIRHIVENVKSRYYGPSGHPMPRLCPTGPCALAEVIDGGNFQHDFHCRFERVSDDSSIDMMIREVPGNATLLVADTETHQGMRRCNICNSYEELFSAGAVYCDEAAPPGMFDPCVEGDFARTRKLERAPPEGEPAA